MSPVYSRKMLKASARFHRVRLNMICEVCVKLIRVMTFRGTGVCCELHRKMRDNEPLGVTSLKTY